MNELPDGYRAIFKHVRRYRELRGRTVIDPNGGTTYCTIRDASGMAVSHGMAKFRSNEPYVRSLGRTIALGRALKVLP